MKSFISWTLDNKLILALVAPALLLLGLATTPFDLGLPRIQKLQTAVDAIPDTGENQQIVFTEWPGRSPRDVEDQITYPLTINLLGIPGVKSVRANSMFGFSSIFVIFDESSEFYFSRTRILEKLNSLPAGSLPEGVRPQLGPDATALGQVYWYTLQGRDEKGNPAGGWDLDELRSIQDWVVKYELQSVSGVAEVASIGGFVREYQIDVNPEKLANFDLRLDDIYRAVKASNLDTGARTMEINGVEYFIRGIGYLQNLEDLERIPIKSVNGTPILLNQVAEVGLGPAARRGLLDIAGAEAVGGVVVTRFGANPMKVLELVREKVSDIAPALPQKTLADGSSSQVTIVPFYDRGLLIGETLTTLSDALRLEVAVTILVILFLISNIRAASLISTLLPFAVLLTFAIMKLTGITADVVALSGIAIAVGTIVDMGIVLSESILKLRETEPEKNWRELVVKATAEVGPAVMVAVLTTLVGFLPVFFMTGSEGKLFKPLAFTKTYALLASLMLSVVFLPAAALFLFKPEPRMWLRYTLQALAVVFAAFFSFTAASALLLFFVVEATRERLEPRHAKLLDLAFHGVILVITASWLADMWMPLGAHRGFLFNFIFTALLVFGILAAGKLFIHFYPRMLVICLNFKAPFLLSVGMIVVLGFLFGLGWRALSAPVSWMLPNEQSRHDWTHSKFYASMEKTFPGLGTEFMPYLDEGDFLYMPTTMPHASIAEAHELMETLDRALYAVPEVINVVGKLGRVDSALDPAPLSMIETIISYSPEYDLDENGRPIRYRFDADTSEYPRDEAGKLIVDDNGKPYRNWRSHIRSSDDIWQEITRAAKIPGLTAAPKLQPISTRIVMLQTGMRAPIGIKVFASDLDKLEKAMTAVEQQLKHVETINTPTINIDRVLGKPYLEFEINREAAARYGLTIDYIQSTLSTAVAGKAVTQTIEGRERYAVRVRLQRELRDHPEAVLRVPVSVGKNRQLPLGELVHVKYRYGPMNIKSENGKLVGYVTFESAKNKTDLQAVQDAQAQIKEARPKLPQLEGIHLEFAGTYQNQLRARETLSLIIPLSLLVIFLLLYMQLRHIGTATLVFSGVLIAWSGGFIMLSLYTWDGFMNFSLLGIDFRELFQIQPYRLSVAVWVGFLALFGIATDDGVLMGTYLESRFKEPIENGKAGIRAAVVEAAERRVRPCITTSATTILALFPVLMSSGRGSDIMIPMAIPSFGGMLLAVVTVFVVPTIYCAGKEFAAK